MPIKIGVPELLIILVIVVLLVGVGRVAIVGKELGSAIRGFREGLKGDDEKKEEKGKDEAEKKT